MVGQARVNIYSLIRLKRPHLLNYNRANTLSYLLIKHVHITLAIISISFFCVRFFWAINDAAQLNRKWVKILPHFVDTLLLACGLYLLFTLGVWPSENAWLAVKLVALVIYILLGTFAIKRGRTKQTKIVTGTLAILVYLYMVNVAISHNPFVII